MLGGCHLNCYIGVPITSNTSFNAMVGLITANGLQILELYLSRKFKVGNSSSLELTWVSSHSQKTIKSSYVASPSRTVSVTMNLILVQEMMHMKPQLGMITPSYCYKEFELSDEEDDYHVNDVVKEVKQCKPINQIMRPDVPEFEDVSGSTYKMSFLIGLWVIGIQT